MRLRGDTAYPLAGGAPRPLASFIGTPRLLAAAGIGNPGRFFALLAGAGLDCATLALPDHHDFRDDPFARTDAAAIFITEKDAVKCAGIAGLADDPRLWVVPVAAHIDGPLAEQILETLRGRTLT
jgi:tetraacyldisaccharide 4'-kinase